MKNRKTGNPRWKQIRKTQKTEDILAICVPVPPYASFGTDEQGPRGQGQWFCPERYHLHLHNTLAPVCHCFAVSLERLRQLARRHRTR